MKPTCSFRSAAFATVILLLASGCVSSGIFTVNNSADSGDLSPGDGKCQAAEGAAVCTLRAAMEEANALAGIQTILFNLPDGDTVIYPVTALPEITDGVIIDGTSQPTFDGGKPVIRVDGSSLGAGPAVSGFINAAGVSATIQGLQILRFSNHGIENYGNLTLDHLEIAVNQASGIQSFIAAGNIDITLTNSTVFENVGPGVNGTNTTFTMDYVTIDRNTGGGLRLTGGSLDLNHGGVADNAVFSDGGGIYLSMAGNPDIRNTTIEGNTSGQNGGGLYLWGLPGTMLIMENCTFDGNYGYDGGGIYIDAGTSHLAASTLINNRAKRHGGGVFVNDNNNPAFWVEEGTVIGRIGEGNIASSAPAAGGLGGGIYNTKQLNISESSIEGNTGDGIYSEQGNLILHNSVIRSNTRNGIISYNAGVGSPATTSVHIEDTQIRENAGTGLAETGGALTMERAVIQANHAGGLRLSGVNLSIADSTVSENTNSGPGGGLWAELCNGTLENSTFTENISYQDGGGMYLALGDSHILTLHNVTISSNYTQHYGGGVLVASGESFFIHVTITKNIQSSGGFYKAYGANATFINSIIAENPLHNCVGHPLSISGGHNLDDDNSCGFTLPGDLSGVAAGLGPLQDNGGNTYTHALLPGSPAIDAAGDAACLPTDQRGILRPQGLHCDMGAFEAEDPATATPPADTDTPTLTATLTGTPTLAGILFGPVNFSTDTVYAYGRSCDPKEVSIQVRVSPEENVQSVGLFHRLEEKNGTQAGPWSEGLAMIPQGGGWYQLTLYGEDLIGDLRSNDEIWVAIQFVANAKDGKILARSEIFRKITLGRCYQ
ncbi:MAG: hypothetical protein JW929_13115 [Anaerolineales bacterium]|nr:hypothetical protein [Anaerolineales bacterium]